MQVSARNKIIVALCNDCLCYQITFLIQQMVLCDAFSVTQCSPLLLRSFFHHLILGGIRLDPTV